MTPWLASKFCFWEKIIELAAEYAHTTLDFISPGTKHLLVLVGKLESEEKDHIYLGYYSISRACHEKQAPQVYLE